MGRKDFGEFAQSLREGLAAGLDMNREAVYFEDETGKKDSKMLIEQKLEGGMSEVTIIHLEMLWHQYQDGVSIGEIVDAVIREKEAQCGQESIEILKNFGDYTCTASKLFIRCISIKQIEGMGDLVYKQVFDIALVLYAVLKDDGINFSSTKIPRKIFEKWERTEEEVLKAALIQTHILFPPRIYNWMKDTYPPSYHVGVFMNPANQVRLSRGIAGNCLTNTRQLNGAAAIFYPGVAERIAQLLMDDFYIVFTSIHEAMIHGIHDVSLAAIHSSLQEVNKSNRLNEVLSGEVYYYNREKMEFGVAKIRDKSSAADSLLSR